MDDKIDFVIGSELSRNINGSFHVRIFPKNMAAIVVRDNTNVRCASSGI